MSSQDFQQSQKQAQSLILAPQLRNSLKILHAPAMELRNAILEELQANPLLEELPMDTISIEEEQSNEREKEHDPSDELNFDEDDFSILNKMGEDWREYYAQENANQSYDSEADERRQHFFDSLTEAASLQQHLLDQAEICDASVAEKEALHYLIGSIDEKGFLSSTISDLALQSRLPFPCMQAALKLLQSFDPPGIGALDLPDSLLIQLRLQGRENSLAARILRDHYKRLLRRRIPDIARKTGTSVEEVQMAIEEISNLDPAPGKRFSEDSNHVVEPDVTIEPDSDGSWKVIMNNDYIPRLRLSGIYKELLAKGNMGKIDRDYIQERIRSGKFLINSIGQRQQTIERVAREILNFQKEFFEHGVSRLRPLTMSTIADAVGVHETTVSRAIANKYVRTPFGVFAFKYFFTPGYTAANGSTVSNKSIKEMLEQMIDSEDPAKPLSDQEIVRRLAEQNIKIARRTVAKYREELGILPTNLRRRYD